MYKAPYPSAYDQIPFPPRFKVLDFTKFSGQGETCTMEHIARFIIHSVEIHHALMVHLFLSSLLGSAFS
jgi:hypothetical protein